MLIGQIQNSKALSQGSKRKKQTNSNSLFVDINIHRKSLLTSPVRVGFVTESDLVNHNTTITKQLIIN